MALGCKGQAGLEGEKEKARGPSSQADRLARRINTHPAFIETTATAIHFLETYCHYQVFKSQHLLPFSHVCHCSRDL